MHHLMGKRIFYFEDDVKNRAIIQIILERAGASLFFERWGRDEPLARLNAAMPIDLILLDLTLSSRATGYDLFDMIRQDNRFDSIPVVAMSSAKLETVLPTLKTKGFAGFISKPINLWTFPQMINSFLLDKQTWAGC